MSRDAPAPKFYEESVIAADDDPGSIVAGVRPLSYTQGKSARHSHSSKPHAKPKPAPTETVSSQHDNGFPHSAIKHHANEPMELITSEHNPMTQKQPPQLHHHSQTHADNLKKPPSSHRTPHYLTEENDRLAKQNYARRAGKASTTPVAIASEPSSPPTARYTLSNETRGNQGPSSPGARGRPSDEKGHLRDSAERNRAVAPGAVGVPEWRNFDSQPKDNRDQTIIFAPMDDDDFPGPYGSPNLDPMNAVAPGNQSNTLRASGQWDSSTNNSAMTPDHVQRDAIPNTTGHSSGGQQHHQGSGRHLPQGPPPDIEASFEQNRPKNVEPQESPRNSSGRRFFILMIIISFLSLGAIAAVVGVVLGKSNSGDKTSTIAPQSTNVETVSPTQGPNTNETLNGTGNATDLTTANDTFPAATATPTEASENSTLPMVAPNNTFLPTSAPTIIPTAPQPTLSPTRAATAEPTDSPTLGTASPTIQTDAPSPAPSLAPLTINGDSIPTNTTTALSMYTAAPSTGNGTIGIALSPTTSTNNVGTGIGIPLPPS